MDSLRDLPVDALVARVLWRLRAYVDGRISDVARGAETPRLAALLVQKYGLGLADATAEFLEGRSGAGEIAKATDEAVHRIDPDWREHARLRWGLRPADISASQPIPEKAADGSH